jgi:hypothetical protein
MVGFHVIALAAALVVLPSLPTHSAADRDDAQPPSAPSPAPGTAIGGLSVGSATIKLVRAYAFAVPDPASPSSEGYRILVTDKPLTPATLALAASAGRNDADRQQLAVELADGAVRGVEAIVSVDRRVTRTNIYTADTAMGMMLLQPTGFSATTADRDLLVARLFTPAPIEDARIGRTIRYDVTFAAAVSRPGR